MSAFVCWFVKRNINSPTLDLNTMKLHRLLPSEADHDLIASFGTARLVRTLAGHLELWGGTEEDRKQARWWVNMFLRRPDDRRKQVAGKAKLQPHENQGMIEPHPGAPGPSPA
jgi:hypothetical protein